MTKINTAPCLAVEVQYGNTYIGKEEDLRLGRQPPFEGHLDVG